MITFVFAHFFNSSIAAPVQPLVLFALIALFSAYYIFFLELKRKAAQGLIRPYYAVKVIGTSLKNRMLLIGGFIGFLLGYKVIYAALNYHTFSSAPEQILLSLNGNLTGGLLMLAAITIFTYQKRKKGYNSARTQVISISPNKSLVFFAGWAVLVGFLGSQLFASDRFESSFVDSDNFNMYAGIVLGVACLLYLAYKRGIKPAHILDIAAPALILVYGIGKLGNHLFGVNHWGIVNKLPKPSILSILPDWLWAYKYPHDCIGGNCDKRLLAVFPTSLYEAILALVLFTVLWLARKRITIPGLLFFYFLIIAGLERFFIGLIEVKSWYVISGLDLSDESIISIALILTGLTGVFLISMKTDFHQEITFRQSAIGEEYL